MHRSKNEKVVVIVHTLQDESNIRIAAFDFDGTSIDGNSPVLLVRYLLEHKMLSKRVVFKILIWAAAYVLHIPQRESWVRELVFTAFEGTPKQDADTFLMQFYDEVIARQGRFRDQADNAIAMLHDAGISTWCVSATFEPIVRRACEFHNFDVQLSTEMSTDENGCYVTQVQGECIEGAQKVTAITQYADKVYGPGNWELVYAFGDHYSDIPMLSAAQHAVAINPDHTLARRARKDGWTICDWMQKKRA